MNMFAAGQSLMFEGAPDFLFVKARDAFVLERFLEVAIGESPANRFYDCYQHF